MTSLTLGGARLICSLAHFDSPSKKVNWESSRKSLMRQDAKRSCPLDNFARAKLEDNVYRMTMADQVLLDPGITQLRTVSYYFGPKTAKDLSLMPKDLKGSMPEFDGAE